MSWGAVTSRTITSGTVRFASPASTRPGPTSMNVSAPEAARDGYERDCGPGEACVFGPSWSDDVTVEGGHNGCDTRNDVLDRDLSAGQVGGTAVPKRFREPGQCVGVEGVLNDPYTGRAIHFTKEHPAAAQAASAAFDGLTMAARVLPISVSVMSLRSRIRSR